MSIGTIPSVCAIAVAISVASGAARCARKRERTIKRSNCRAVSSGAKKAAT